MNRRVGSITKALAAALVALAAAGCATVDPYAHAPMRDHLVRADDVGDCARLFRDIDASIDRARVRDAQAPRVPGFPYLRVSRFVESLSDQARSLRGGFSPWSELMARLDREARAAELSNAGDVKPPAAALDGCRYRLAVADNERIELLVDAARVPDDYSPALRALGLYPLTRIAFAAGIRAWHAETRAIFALPNEALKESGRLVRYAPAARIESQPAVARSAAFGLPVLSNAQWAKLLAHHAPRLAIDTVDDNDRIGPLIWRTEADALRVRVDTGAAAAYTRVAFTRIADRVHLQLVYTFWFPARPPESSVDLLAGALDGLIWRVTLDRDLTPLAYDTIHPCGCFHLFFPTEHVRARAQPESLDEGLFAPQSVRAQRGNERIELRVATRTHYLQRVGVVAATATSPAMTYALRDEDELRRLSLPAGGTRSVFDEDGFIAGAERAERFFFWPMGIVSAGQMRQWGRHATAFVGRRHFDDPGLFDRYFEIVRERSAVPGQD